MAYVLKTGKIFSFGAFEVVNPLRRICSITPSIQFDEEGNKFFSINVMIGTYDEGDWLQKIEEFSVPSVILPYGNGRIDLQLVYTKISEMNISQLEQWESDEIA